MALATKPVPSPDSGIDLAPQAHFIEAKNISGETLGACALVWLSVLVGNAHPYPAGSRFTEIQPHDLP